MAQFSTWSWSQAANVVLWVTLWIMAALDFVSLRTVGWAALGRSEAYRYTGNEAVLLISAEFLAGLLFFSSFVQGLRRKNRILRRR